MQEDRQILIDALIASKGRSRAFAEAFVDNFGDKLAAKASGYDDPKWSSARFEVRTGPKSFDRYPYLSK